MQVQLIPEDPTKNPSFVEVPDSGMEQLKEMQRLIRGYVEMLHTPKLDRFHNVILCDEDARPKGSKPNYRATTMTGYAATLFGNVIICGTNRTGTKWVAIHIEGEQ